MCIRDSTYEDRAISGRTDNRPEFQRMMRDVEDGKFQYVWAWKSNRMGRNMMQARSSPMFSTLATSRKYSGRLLSPSARIRALVTL